MKTCPGKINFANKIENDGRIENERKKDDNMDAIRVPPIIGVYDVIKYINPRMVHLQFLQDASSGRVFMMDGQDNILQRFTAFRHPRYYEAHDRSGDLIFERVKLDDVLVTVTLSLIEKANGKHRFYLTFVRELHTFIELEGSHVPMNYLKYSSKFVGKTVDAAVFEYLDFVSRYRLY